MPILDGLRSCLQVGHNSHEDAGLVLYIFDDERPDMKLTKLTPKKSLNKAFLKVKPSRSAIEYFKASLIKLIDQIGVLCRIG